MAMSVNAVLMKFFKLPPAVRMMLALLGFGSLASLLFRFMPGLRSGSGLKWMLIIIGGGLLIFGIIWLVRWLFFGKKASKLEGALESQGPTRGDIAEQEQIYKEKFRGKLADLKQNGLSVYKLPWFVLMGEPGCGKTASLIHSGLDFPLGKDEVPGFGGTRNYNWWFTNEAVILDTAGRIAFHEEGTTDKTEWEYFLKLLKANRPRCPANGVVIALPADKLLRDSSDERAQKASILRDRLRQVHQILGVRFPTYALVTKMDLIGGFNEYFDGIRADLQQRNQMLGWSRPGEDFEQPYDPGTFPDAFDEVHQRLRHWAMRYLQRKVPEDELGMIVTFPEAFRELRQPLNEYIGTIFQKSPLLEPPFFRGFYFTSAVQEGAPIFDIFKTSQSDVDFSGKAVDSKAFFIHDFYANKVFPEQGLVFRSAKHVALNSRMRRLVWIGSAAMVVLLFALFFIGWWGVNGLLTQPVADCTTAREVMDNAPGEFQGTALRDHLALAQDLEDHIDAYNGAWAGLMARALFIGADITTPQGYVRNVHTPFVLKTLFEPVVAETGEKLAGPPPGDTRETHMDALETYAQWLGEIESANPPEFSALEVDRRAGEYQTLMGPLTLPAEVEPAALADQFRFALNSLAGDSASRSFAHEILRDTGAMPPKEAADTLIAAIGQLRRSWARYAELEGELDADLAYWNGLAERLQIVSERYGELLAIGPRFSESFNEAGADFQQLSAEIEYVNDSATTYDSASLGRAWRELESFLDAETVPQDDVGRIRLFSDIKQHRAARWNSEFDGIETALTEGAAGTPGQHTQRVLNELRTARAALNDALDASFEKVLARLGIPTDTEDPFAELGRGLLEIQRGPKDEFDTRVPKASVTLSRSALGENDWMLTVLRDLRELTRTDEGVGAKLQDLRQWPALLRGEVGATSGDDAVSRWVSAVGTQEGARANAITRASGVSQQRFWEPVRLFDLAQAVRQARGNYSQDQLYDQMAERARASVRSEPHVGLGGLVPGSDAPADLPFDVHSFNRGLVTTVAAAEEPAREPEPEPEPQPSGQESRFDRLRRLRGEDQAAAGEPERGAEPDPEPRIRRPTRAAPSLLQAYHTRPFLTEVLNAGAEVRKLIGDAPAASELRSALDAAEAEYLSRYYGDWMALYRDPRKLHAEPLLELLQQCQQGAMSWPVFQQALERQGPQITEQVRKRVEALCRNVLLTAFSREPLLDEQAAMRCDDAGRAARELLGQLNTAVNDDARDPETGPASRLARAWAAHSGSMATLKLEQAPDPLPTQSALSSEFRDTVLAPEQCRPIAPLLDLAGYYEDLLQHEVQSQLYSVFQNASGFPVDGPGGGTMPPDAFLSLLTKVRNFESAYGELLNRVGSGTSVFDACRRWNRFLFGNESGGTQPATQQVGVSVREDSGGFNAYERLSIRLPVLDRGRPADPIVLTRQDARDEVSKTYEWNLGRTASSAEADFELSQKNPAATDYPETIKESLSLPSSPWALLVLIARENAGGGSPYTITLRRGGLRTPVEYTIVISLERDYPGPLGRPSAPGPMPRMSAAQQYLSGAP